MKFDTCKYKKSPKIVRNSNSCDFWCLKIAPEFWCIMLLLLDLIVKKLTVHKVTGLTEHSLLTASEQLLQENSPDFIKEHIK